MSKYVQQEFSCQSRGLSELVAKLQGQPKHTITTLKRGAVPNIEGQLSSVLSIIERIQGLSPKSPGAAQIPAAVAIGWGVYQWLQEVALAVPAVTQQGGRGSQQVPPESMSHKV